MTEPLTATLRLIGRPRPRVIAASDSIRGLLGFPASHFLDASFEWSQLVHTDDQGMVERLLAANLASTKGRCGVRLRHLDGRIRCLKLDYLWIFQDAQPDTLELQFSDEQGQLPLAENELRFKTIFEQLPAISVQGYNRARQVIFWNRASELLYGYTREQAMGRQLEDLIIPATLRESVIEMITAWQRGGRPWRPLN